MSLFWSQVFAVFCDGTPDLGAMSWRGGTHCARTPVGSIPNTYVTNVRRKDSIQQNFGRHVEACLQRRVDACNARSRRDPSNSVARKMAGWSDWNFVGRALSC